MRVVSSSGASSRVKHSSRIPLPPSLIQTLLYLSENSPYFSPILKKHSRKPIPEWTWDTFKKLPVTTKEDLAKDNDLFLCVPQRHIRDWTSTSGTTGKPVYIGLTASDLRRLARNEAWTYRMAGLKKGDILQILITLDKRFMAGLAYWLGAQYRGLSVIRSGPGTIPLQWEIMRQRRTTAILAVPSFIPRLLDYAENQGWKPEDCTVHTLIAVGEPTLNDEAKPNNLTVSIQKRWPLKIISTYASTELQTAFTECHAHCGLHLQNNLLYAEVLDEEWRDVHDGEEGQLVFTHYGVQGMPLLRYATGDIVKVWYEPCPCGLRSLRIGPVKGRLQQRLKLNGTTVYPSQYVQIMNDLGLAQKFQLIIAKEGAHDILKLIISEEVKSLFPENFILAAIRNHGLPVPQIKWIKDSVLKEALFCEKERKIRVIKDNR